MRKFKILFLIIICFILFSLSGCNEVPKTPGKAYDLSDDSADSGIEESDIIKVYGDYILRSSITGLYIIHTNEGMLNLVASHDISRYAIGDLLVYENYLISISTFLDEEIKDNRGKTISISFHTEVEVYDLTDLSLDGFDFISIRSLQLKGHCTTARILEDALYLACVYKGEAYDQIQDITANISDNGQERAIENAYLISNENDLVYNYATITATSLLSLEQESKAVVLYGELQDFCLYTSGIYPIFIERENQTSIIAKLSLSNLQLVGQIKDNTFSVLNRFSINDSGSNIMVVTIHETYGSRLSIYSYSLQLVGRIDRIAPREKLMSVRYNDNFCYVVTFLRVDPVYKIDISNPSKPRIVDELKITGYSTYLHLINEMDLAIGVGIGDNNRAKISLFDVRNDRVTEIKSIDTDIFSLEAIDPRLIFIDRQHKMIILTGLRAPGETSSQGSLGFNVLIFKYSSTDLILHKTLNTPEEKNTKISVQDLFTSNFGLRCVVLGDYLYLIKNFSVISFDLKNNYEIKDELTFVTFDVIEEDIVE